MKCNVCQRDTPPVVIGGRDYCSICGHAYVGGDDAPVRRNTSDVTRRPAAPVTLDAAARQPTAASDLHHRAAKPVHVLDLRAPAVTAPPDTPTVHQTGKTLAAKPKSTVQEAHIRQFTDRFERARKFSRSAQISRFGTDRFGHIMDPAKMYDKFGHPTLETLVNHDSAPGHSVAAPAPVHHAVLPSASPSHLAQMPHLAVTQHEAMARMAPSVAATATPPAVSLRRSFKLSPHNTRTLSVAAAVVVMGAYVWFQNYPKYAISNAGSQAGLSATMPGYVPSSYTLAGTNSSPGLVTLRFTSPSATDALEISQHRTTWDSSSLLDNYVAKNADDYASVDGQGLTIYLFNNNQATWVNHGVWFSITGAARLSREQILKIAYSL